MATRAASSCFMTFELYRICGNIYSAANLKALNFMEHILNVM